MGLGSVIAGVFGYEATFLVAALGNLLYLVFENMYMPWGILKDHSEGGDEMRDNFVKRVMILLKKKDVWRVLITAVAPQFFLLMIIVCLIPARVQSGDMLSSVLTFSNLINGLAGLYLGDVLFKRLRAKNSLSRIMGYMLILGSISMFIMNIPVFGVVFVLISALLTGFVDGIGTPVSTDIFMMENDIKSNLDETESLMIYSLVGSAIMAIAPFILEACEKNIIWMSVVAAMLVLFALSAFRNGKSAASEQDI